MRRKLRVADLYCGAGGTSTGLVRAAEEAGVEVDLLAVNHWAVAVETHATNHPRARHLQTSLDTVEPRKVIECSKLDVLIASPECTHHSTARGGRPMSDQSRSGAWKVVDWATAVAPEIIIVENVPEFAGWGPLANGRPIESRKGETFSAWLSALVSLGYTVEWRILNAANFGDPTTRRRLFVLARRGRRAPVWPVPSHRDPKLHPDLYEGTLAPWRSARGAVIDWQLRGTSIFGRTKPLAESTLRRIGEGLRRFGGANAEPFLALLRGTSTVRSVNKPLPTLTAGWHVALCQPYIVPFWGERSGQAPRTHSADEPLPTVPAQAAKFGLLEPFIVHTTHGGRVHSTERPVPTITAGHRGELAFVLPFSGDRGQAPRCHSVDEPMRTLTTEPRFAVAMLAPEVDVMFRMLQPHELAAAMGFPKCYKFSGNKTETVKQIGNAVPVGVSTALCGSAIQMLQRGEK